ncbi:MAG: class I SAM-dependent methyltransferase [Nitrospinae bacterium]|nr:class I SAM-dependent methyltransferase [Nitrospinota bacterium]
MNAQIKKWDKAAKSLDWAGPGIERRYGEYKRELFAKAHGTVLLAAAGTGLDFDYFPPGLNVTGIDFSATMLEMARVRARLAGIRLTLGDIQRMPFKDEAFDTVVASCTFCSVPDPVEGLREVKRVLKTDGKLLMFEHVRAGNPVLGKMMDIMSPISRIFGPEINRRTKDNVEKAGFAITREYNVYLDVVKIFEAKKQ